MKFFLLHNSWEFDLLIFFSFGFRLDKREKKLSRFFPRSKFSHNILFLLALSFFILTVTKFFWYAGNFASLLSKVFFQLNPESLFLQFSADFLKQFSLDRFQLTSIRRGRNFFPKFGSETQKNLLLFESKESNKKKTPRPSWAVRSQRSLKSNCLYESE